MAFIMTNISILLGVLYILSHLILINTSRLGFMYHILWMRKLSLIEINSIWLRSNINQEVLAGV